MTTPSSRPSFRRRTIRYSKLFGMYRIFTIWSGRKYDGGGMGDSCTRGQNGYESAWPRLCVCVCERAADTTAHTGTAHNTSPTCTLRAVRAVCRPARPHGTRSKRPRMQAIRLREERRWQNLRAVVPAVTRLLPCPVRPDAHGACAWPMSGSASRAWSICNLADPGIRGFQDRSTFVHDGSFFIEHGHVPFRGYHHSKHHGHRRRRCGAEEQPTPKPAGHPPVGSF